MKRLYIIGNGFDRAHGLPTSYSDFAKYLSEKQKCEFHRIGLLYNQFDERWLWKDYEANLCNIDIEGCVEKRIDYWNTLEQHDIKRLFDSLYEDLHNLFHKWINTINVDGCCKIMNLSPKDYYITFNYTNVLEKVYKIPRDHICYIHGDTANQPYLRPVIGHSEGFKQVETRVLLHKEGVKRIIGVHGKPEWSKSGERYADFILKCFQELIGSLKKLPNNNLTYYKFFFEELDRNNFTEVYILGHSLAAVDIPYFRFFLSMSSVRFAKWFLSYRGDNKGKKEKDNLRVLFCRISELRRFSTMITIG